MFMIDDTAATHFAATVATGQDQQQLPAHLRNYIEATTIYNLYFVAKMLSSNQTFGLTKVFIE